MVSDGMESYLGDNRSGAELAALARGAHRRTRPLPRRTTLMRLDGGIGSGLRGQLPWPRLAKGLRHQLLVETRLKYVRLADVAPYQIAVSMKLRVVGVQLMHSL